MLSLQGIIIVILNTMAMVIYVRCTDLDHQEAALRIHDRLLDMFESPPNLLRQLYNYRLNLAFPHDMHAMDRDAVLRFNGALAETYPEFDSFYYGLEDGLFVGQTTSGGLANYREPGDSGYQVYQELLSENNSAMAGSELEKHFHSCLDDAGGEAVCLLQPGEKYVECLNGCPLQKCNHEERSEENVKYCKSYVIRQVPREATHLRYGYVPRSTCCLGAMLQTQKQCKKSFLPRYLEGDYAYCGGNGAICNHTFLGCFATRQYDPRLRPWYINTKQKQKPNWSPPYIFFVNLDLGITFSYPIYQIQNHTVFAGVLAVDLRLSSISSFLIQNYNHTDTLVAIVEDSPPHYLIATSVATTIIKHVLSTNNTQPCPNPNTHKCQPVRLPMDQIQTNHKDRIISKSFSQQVENKFTQTKLATIHMGHNQIYVSQTIPFSISNEFLPWRILIVNPVQTDTNDTIQKGDTTFIILITVSTLGLGTCLALLSYLLQNKHQREIVYSDWRFTSVFIVNGSLLNAASYSMIGPNTNQLCMTRMWVLHLGFVMTLSPLLAKIFRMYQLIGRTNHKLKTISHAQTASMAMPFVLLQIFILTIFSIVDPSQQVEIVDTIGSTVTHRLVCKLNNPTIFFFVQLILEGGLVLLGCTLAYKTRRMKKQFGESKQLTFAMYNIALVGSLILIVLQSTDPSEGTKRVFIACGIFWTTSVSCGAFVIPRYMQIRQRTHHVRKFGSNGLVQVTGVNCSDRYATIHSKIDIDSNVISSEKDIHPNIDIDTNLISSEGESAFHHSKQLSKISEVDMEDSCSFHIQSLLVGTIPNVSILAGSIKQEENH